MKKFTLPLFISILTLCLFAFSGCKKDKDKDDPKEEIYYFKANIGGKSYSEKVTETNGYIAGSSLGGMDIVNFSADIGPDDETVQKPSMSITKGLMYNYLSATNPDFINFFKPGSYTYTTSPDYNPILGNGFEVGFADENGDYWSTDAGAKDQTNSKIKIISVDETESFINFYIGVKIQFSCTLYNLFTGEKKELKDGEFYGLFGKI